MARVIAGVFEHFSDADAAVSELLDVGFPMQDISIMSGAKAIGSVEPHPRTAGTGAVVGAGAGAIAGAAGGILAALGSFAIPGIGPVVAGGALAAAFTGANFGAVA